MKLSTVGKYLKDFLKVEGNEAVSIRILICQDSKALG